MTSPNLLTPMLGASIFDKHVMDGDGNWTVVPHLMWRDATGWHDAPVMDVAQLTRGADVVPFRNKTDGDAK